MTSRSRAALTSLALVVALAPVLGAWFHFVLAPWYLSSDLYGAYPPPLTARMFQVFEPRTLFNSYVLLLPLAAVYALVMTDVRYGGRLKPSGSGAAYCAIGTLLGAALPFGLVWMYHIGAEKVLRLFCVPGAVTGLALAALLQLRWTRFRDRSDRDRPPVAAAP